LLAADATLFMKMPAESARVATVKVYAVPEVKPLTVTGLVLVDPVMPPGDDVAT
jgi:hypothetical protein